MTTGLLENLKQDFDLKRWMKETLVRQLGICCQLREEGNLSESEIVDALQKQYKKTLMYNEEKIKNYSVEVIPPSKEEALAQQKELIEQYTKKLAAAEKNLIEVKALCDKFNSVQYNGNNDIVKGVLKLGKSQLDIMLEDVEWRVKSYEQTLSDAKSDSFVEKYMDVSNEVEYNKKRLEEYKIQEVPNYAELYKDFCKDIDSLDFS